MGSRGPAKESTAAKLARGETRPSRLNAAEPKPQPNEPELPADLSARAKAVWIRVVADMRGTGVIVRVDQDVLRCYCEAVELYEQARSLVSGGSLLIQRREGELVKNPLLQVVRDNRDAVRLFARELGLSPSGRAGLNVGGTGATGDIDDELPPSPRALRLVGGDAG